MNRIYLDEDRTIEAEMSSDASLQTDQINYKHRKINTRDLGFYFSLYCQQMKKQLSKHLNNIVRDFYSRIQIFLDDQTSYNQQSKSGKIVNLLKNWKPKLQIFEEKFLELKANLPHIADKKKNKIEDFRKIRFVQILERILNQVEPKNYLNPQTPSKVQFQYYLHQAQTLYDQGRFEQAITRSKQALKNQVYPELNFITGNCYKAIGRYKQGINQYNKAVSLNPKGCYYNNRGNCYLCLQNIQKSQEDYRKAIQLQPNNQVYLGNYGNVCLTLKKFEQAIDVYNKAIKSDCQNDFFFNNRAFAQIKLKRFSDAIQSYNQAIRLSPLNHVYLKNRANLYMQKKLIRNAVQDISKAIQIQPNKHQYYFLKGKWQYLSGFPQEAMLSFRRACQLQPHKKTYKDYYQAIKTQLGYK